MCNRRAFRYIDGYGSSIDTSAAAGIGRQVSVQHHKRLGKCVLADDLRPSQWCRDVAMCKNPSTAGIRGTNFVTPANPQKIIVALYGWDWQIKDPKRRGGGGYAGRGGDVCSWPRRPDGSLRETVRVGAAAVQDESIGESNGHDTADAGDAGLFASVLGTETGAEHSHKRANKPMKGGHKRPKEQRPPPTREEMTSILLG